mgnify:CR=1 FL=1
MNLTLLLGSAQPRSTLFTGSQRVTEKLAVDLKGKVGGGGDDADRRAEERCNLALCVGIQPSGCYVALGGILVLPCSREGGLCCIHAQGQLSTGSACSWSTPRSAQSYKAT